MTRINLVVPKELTDQHLKAEIRELPRIFSLILKKSKNKTINFPTSYRLGTGHVIFFYNKLQWLHYRYLQLLAEAKERKFKVDEKIVESYLTKIETLSKTSYYNNWTFNSFELELSRERLKEKINMKPMFYKYYRKPLVQSYFSNYPWYSSHSS